MCGFHTTMRHVFCRRFRETIAMKMYMNTVCGSLSETLFLMVYLQLSYQHQVCVCGCFSETMHLKMYFDCVFSNLTTCLQAANSSQMNGLPDPGTISKGIVDMCNSRDGQ